MWLLTINSKGDINKGKTRKGIETQDYMSKYKGTKDKLKKTNKKTASFYIHAHCMSVLSKCTHVIDLCIYIIIRSLEREFLLPFPQHRQPSELRWTFLIDVRHLHRGKSQFGPRTSWSSMILDASLRCSSLISTSSLSRDRWSFFISSCSETAICRKSKAAPPQRHRYRCNCSCVATCAIRY